tara:strand:- start:1069 stop:3993 length:2925 start_codon:yes stop_codon:yes gene_type:complete
MKKLTLFILIIFFAGCTIAPRSPKNWAESTLSQLSLREKIAQMMIFRMNMRFKDISEKKWDEIIQLIKTDGIGGIHLWSGDASSSLIYINEIQNKSRIPIILDADIEYGLNQRFPSGTDFPPMMAIAATGNPENAYLVGKIVAEESRAVGIQWNLSPVVDVNNNPANPIINTRSFGENAEIVERYAVPYMKGLQDNGMLATAKHFPGHGDTETDSHSSLAMIPSDSSRLWTVEIAPFQAMSDAGVDAIMVAHIHAPEFQKESDSPASLDSFWIQTILREKIGFKGVVITDGMGMGGIVKNYSDAFALVETIKAGSDVVIQNYDLKGSIDIIEQAVLRNEIPITRINSAALKMLKLKQKVGLHHTAILSSAHARKILNKEENKSIASQIASEAITCVKNNLDLIPLASDSNSHLFVMDIYDSKNNHSLSNVTKGLKKSGLNFKSIQIDESDTDEYLKTVIDNIPSNSRILLNVFVNQKAWKNEIYLSKKLTNFVRSLMNVSDDIILASLGTPYLIQDFPEIPVYLCAYKNNQVMQRALVKALIGKTRISGKLPVTIPGVAAIGDGKVIEKKKYTQKKNNYSSGKEIIQVMPSEIGVNTENLSKLLKESVDDKAWPGGVLLAAKDGNIFIKEAVGYHTYEKNRKTRTSDIFDIASITKVISTTSAIMKLVEEEKINLNDPVVKYLPEFKGKQSKYFKQKSKITIRNLLTHTSGLAPFKQFYLMESNVRVRLDSLYNIEPETGLEEKMIYSDIGIILLGKLVEKVSSVRLDLFVDSLIFDPMGMTSTFYNPKSDKKHRIVPTEVSELYREGLIHSEVHDENAHSLGGVAGHAGLFSTVRDLSRFSQMMLNKGLYGWTRIFRSETVELFTQRANIIKGNSRCLGWDSPEGEASGGVYLSDSSFGHTGFTGTSLWIDPENNIIVILLTNAVHPNRSAKNPKYYEWRQRIHSGVYETLGFNEKNPNLKLKSRWQKLSQID